MQSISLKNYTDQEEVNKVNTPLSLEACYREGIDPEELLHYSIQKFARPNLPLSIQKMNYDFYETQRKKLLHIAKERYKSLTVDQKKVKSSKSLQMNEVLSTEIQKLKEKKLKYISRLVNYKIDEIKHVVEGDKQSLDSKAQTTMSLKINKLSSTSKDFRQHKDELVKVESNRERDAKLIEEERKKMQKIVESEKFKVEDADRRRKAAEVKLEEHLKKVKEMRERENEEKLQKIIKKSEQSQQKLMKIHQQRIEDKKGKILQGQERISKVMLIKNLTEENFKQDRDKIIQLKNEKIEEHIKNKQKTQQEILEKIKENNQRQELKSKQSLKRISEALEEKKEKTLQTFSKMQKKLEFIKKDQEQYQELLKQKNKLKEVERNWNHIRASRKQDFHRNEILNEIRSNTLRVQDILSARDFMHQFRYDLNMKTEASRSKIDLELYQMEVKKRVDLEKINSIIKEQVSDDLHLYSTQ